ncbi:MAG TPA: NADH-quinone oxidoreductase subunit C [bacterium]|jgi:NADH-quinone oxidoreductase subunit C|nr:NADH-quinone oxidoreductase subunit C [bacterium]
MERQALLDAVLALCPEAAADNAPQLPEVKVPRARFRALMEHLHSDPALALDYPMCMTAVDWPEQAVITCVYHLYSFPHGHKLVVKCDADRSDARMPTVSDLWRGCEWFEREVYDLFGVTFEGHPDLRRIMLTDDWVGFPLRKDYRDSRIAGKTY